jgi:TMEM175 potassium channel family protein
VSVDTSHVADDLGFAEDETLEERAFDYARTVALSDGVFAIAMTLLVLQISVPQLISSEHSELGKRLLDHRDEFTSYAISFAVISVFWIRHHVFFRGLATIDTQLTVLNLAYLGFVAFIPYPTRLLGLYGDEPASVVLYASTILIIATLSGLSRVHAKRSGLLTPVGERELARREHWLIAPAIFAASIPVAFISPTAAELMWVLLLIPGVGRTLALLRPGRGAPK